MAVVHIRYYTDPACPWSWAQEPALRRLLNEFGPALEIEYVMSGMGSALEDGPGFALKALEAGEQSGMPVDVRLWLQDPPASSQPACMGVKAAAEQGQAEAYLRRLREGFFCRRRRLDSADGLLAEAREVTGIDLERFRISLGSHGVLEQLGADLELARQVDPEHHGEGEERVKLPSLEFQAEGGQMQGVYGPAGYEALRAAALAASGVAEAAAPGVTEAAAPTVAEAAPPTIEEALRWFGSMTTAEISEVCQLAGPTAPAALWRLATEWRVTVERCGTGEMWMLAGGA
jgi:predicted DsbA family dithiol-disulfide isomerase